MVRFIKYMFKLKCICTILKFVDIQFIYMRDIKYILHKILSNCFNAPIKPFVCDFSLAAFLLEENVFESFTLWL